MTFPGAETIKAGIIGTDIFLSLGILRGFLDPLTPSCDISSVGQVGVRLFEFGIISEIGEGKGLVSDGVSIPSEAVLEFDGDGGFSLRVFPPDDFLVW
jgi:hypothetical protein